MPFAVDTHARPGLHGALIVAAVAALLATIVAGYHTQRLVIDRGVWVEHTSEVRLALAQCSLRLERTVDGPHGVAASREAFQALRAAESVVTSLTADNAEQQLRAGRAMAISDRLEATSGEGEKTSPEARASADDLRVVFADMETAEERLMTTRRDALDGANQQTSYGLAVRAALTIGLAVLAIVLLWRQRVVVARTSREIYRERAMLASVLDSVGEGVMAMTPGRELLAVNEAARGILGTDFPTDRLADDWRGVVVATNEDGTPLAAHLGPLASAARGESVNVFVLHVRNVARGDEGTWLSASSRPILDQDGRIVAGVVTLRDVTQQRRHADELRALSLRDELTQLYNRRGFLALAEQHLRTATRDRAPFALLYADLNGLKRINDELGHEVGDRAIKDGARVLRGTFRDADVVARLGGDEFVVLVADASPATGDALIRRLTKATRAQNTGAEPYRLSMSIGLAFYDPENPQPLHELIAAADQRMFSAKRGPRSSIAPLRVVSG